MSELLGPETGAAVILFWLSIAPLLLGPLVVRRQKARPSWLRGLGGFITVSVAGLVFLHILPHTIAEVGVWAVAAAIAGLVLPFVIEQVSHRHPANGFRMAAAMALLGLAVHGMIDGVGLAGGDAGARGGRLLALAVVLHRIPVGLAIWWVAAPRFGRRAAMVIVALLVTTSSFGYVVSYFDTSVFSTEGWLILQALLAGSLLHVVAHQMLEPSMASLPRWHVASTGGGLLGVALLIAISELEAEHGPSGLTLAAGQTFLVLALDSAPPLVVGFLLAGSIKALAARGLVAWLSRGRGLWPALKGTVIGLPLHICSCAIIPVYRGLIRRGVPTYAVLAFFVTAPEIGVATVALSIELLGFELAFLRVALASGLGLLAGILAGTAIRPAAKSVASGFDVLSAPPASPQERLRAGLVYGFGDIVDHTMPWIVAGLGLAAVLEPLLPPQRLAAFTHEIQILAAALVAIPIYVCATGSTPLVALLMHKGLSAGAAMAFLLIGPATNRNTWGVLAEYHGRRAATLFTIAFCAVAVLMGYAVDLWLPGEFSVAIQSLADEGHGALSWLCLLLLAGLLLLSLLRQGVSGFVHQLLALFGHRHDRVHGLHHEHGRGRKSVVDMQLGE